MVSNPSLLSFDLEAYLTRCQDRPFLTGYCAVPVHRSLVKKKCDWWSVTKNRWAINPVSAVAPFEVDYYSMKRKCPFCFASSWGKHGKFGPLMRPKRQVLLHAEKCKYWVAGANSTKKTWPCIRIQISMQCTFSLPLIWDFWQQTKPLVDSCGWRW